MKQTFYERIAAIDAAQMKGRAIMDGVTNAKIKGLARGKVVDAAIPPQPKINADTVLALVKVARRAVVDAATPPTAEQHAAIKTAMTKTIERIRELAGEFGLVTESIDQEVKAARNRDDLKKSFAQFKSDRAMDQYLGAPARDMSIDEYINGPSIGASIEAQLAAIDPATKLEFIARGDRKVLDEAARLEGIEGLSGLQEGKNDTPEDDENDLMGELTAEKIDSILDILSLADKYLKVIDDERDAVEPGALVGTKSAESVGAFYGMLVALSLQHHLMAV